MTTEDTETPDLLAAEYVLGTLGANEREQAGALIASDPAFADLVRYWERQLGQLHAMAQPIEPPPEIWARIKARIEGVEPGAAMLLPDPERTARAAAANQIVVDLTRYLRRWRGIAAGATGIAAGLAAVVVTSIGSPEILPQPLRPKPIEVVRTIEVPGARAARFVAVLQREAASPAFILTVDVADRSLMVRRVSAEPQEGKSYELWLVSGRFPDPRSLGIVGANDFTPRPTLAGYDSATINDATYAVSLEPEGGSPTGVPTGPVLFTGKLVEAVPEESR